jgi:hypothetical protein
MEFYGFSIWHDLLIGSQPWLDSLAIGTGDDFDPTGDGFTKVFSALRRVLDDSGLRGKLGGCLHTSSSFPAIMERFDLLPAFIAARDIFAKEIPLEVGMHCSFDPGDLPLAGRYPEVLRRDFDLATKLGAVTIVAHFPKKAGDTTPALLTELLSQAHTLLGKPRSKRILWVLKAHARIPGAAYQDVTPRRRGRLNRPSPLLPRHGPPLILGESRPPWRGGCVSGN